MNKERLIIIGNCIVAVVLWFLNSVWAATVIVYIIYDLAVLIAIVKKSKRITWVMLIIPFSSISGLWHYYFIDGISTNVILASLFLACVIGYFLSRKGIKIIKLTLLIFVIFLCVLGQIHMLNDFTSSKVPTSHIYVIDSVDDWNEVRFSSDGCIRLYDISKKGEEIKISIKQEDIKKYHKGDKFVLNTYYGGLGIEYMKEKDLDLAIKSK